MIDMQTTKRDDYLAKFPAGCVPAFEATDGTIIQQSGAIATYGECRVVPFELFRPSPFVPLVPALQKRLGLACVFMMSLQLLVIPVLMTFVDKFSDEWYRYTSEKQHTRPDLLWSWLPTLTLSFLHAYPQS